MEEIENKRFHLGRGLLVLVLGSLISSLPLIWPLTATDYDPNYGKFPLWIMANCGVITLASFYSFIVISILRRWKYLWISIVGLFCIVLSLFLGFAFWVAGILLLPVAPFVLIASSILAVLPEREKREQAGAPNPTPVSCAASPLT